MNLSKNNSYDDFADVKSDDIPENPQDDKASEEANINPDVLTINEILGRISEAPTNSSAINSLKAKMSAKSDTNPAENADKPILDEETKKTDIAADESELMEKFMPYIADDESDDDSDNAKPLYNLQSVADILRENSQKSIDEISKEYGMFDVEEYLKKRSEEEEREKAEFEKKQAEIKQKAEKNTKEEKTEIPVISDIDITDSPLFDISQPAEPPQDGGTITFTPIKDEKSKLNKTVVSTQTFPIDFTNELLKVDQPVNTKEQEEPALQNTEFEDFVPKTEFSDEESGKEILKKLAKEKKREFLSVSGSIIIVLLLLIFKLPLFSGLFLSFPRTLMIICCVITLLSVFINSVVFKSLKNLFAKKITADISTVFAVVSVALYSVFATISKDIFINVLLLLAFILLFSSLNRFMKVSAMLLSFKQIHNTKKKHAVRMISDPAITFAMSKGSTEGDALIAAPQVTSNVKDFMKYYTYGEFLGGKAVIILAVSLFLSVLAGVFAGTYFGKVATGFYTAAVIQCLASLPCLFMIDSLPLYDSAKKLARFGAMIAGKTGAEKIEEANSVVFNSKDLFPEGSITLHKIQILSENDLEDTIIRAASLTKAVGSPLEQIFKKIAKTGKITALPDSDTVKYEETLGISGWVDNRLLFIGNRTLMEAHGISVPSVEVDRKFLRKGFFPVYLATKNEACALIAVKYTVSKMVSDELRRLTNSGITVLLKNSDPNLTEDMICDYFGLYPDSVKVMSAAGCHIYNNTVSASKSFSAPAAFRNNPLGMLAILNCADKIKRSNILLTAFYIIAAVFGILLFIYASFSGSDSMLGDTAVLLYSLICATLSYLIYLIEKP